MPLYYDTTRQTTTNGSGNTKTVHLAFMTATPQETARITGVYVDIYNSSTVGSGFLMVQDAASRASGGTVATPRPRNLRTTAAQLIGTQDGSAITAGGTLTTRVYIGFAQTGGQNGWVAVEPAAAVQMMSSGSNPADIEVASQTTTASQNINVQFEHCEGT